MRTPRTLKRVRMFQFDGTDWTTLTPTGDDGNVKTEDEV